MAVLGWILGILGVVLLVVVTIGLLALAVPPKRRND